MRLTIVSDAFTTTAQSGLQRPSWDTDSHVNMDAARRAQSALVFSLTPVTAMPDKLPLALVTTRWQRSPRWG